MRSLALAQAGDADAVAAAIAAGADALVLDLLGLPQGPGLDAARLAARDVLGTLRTAPPEGRRPLRRFVRIHSLTSRLADGDLDIVMAGQPDGIVLPAADPDCIGRLALRIAVREAQLGLPACSTRIIALMAQEPASMLRLCESPRSGRGAPAAAAPSGPTARLAGFGFSPGQLQPTIGLANRGHGGASDVLARGLVVAAAAAAGIAAVIDAPPAGPAGRDIDAWARRALRDGFTAGFAARTEEIPVLNRVFSH